MLADGQPSHTLHDPVRNLFFQIDWLTFEVLRRWRLGNSAAVAFAVSKETTLQLEKKDVDDIVTFFSDNHLLQPLPGSAADFASQLKKRKGSLGQWLLHNYLFLRIPLAKPDRWLTRWAAHMDFFYSRQFLYLTLAALGWGMVEVYRQWERFTATFVDTISWSGLASYGLTLAFIKVLHELGHAFTAKRLGCRVPTMGIAFLVLWPVAYTDTNEVWKLTKRRQRLSVVAAGVLTELTIAAWATLAWALLPDGTPKSMAFLLATTTWVTSVLLNASPFMRFDGYFLLSDWLGMPNLHARAFALARWKLREWLFALGATPSEYFPRSRQIGLILFAYATWIYRLVVFLGIAALVYSFFIKAVGIMLFAVEIGWFVLLPLYRELQVWRTLGPILRKRARVKSSAAIALLLIFLLIIPWPTKINTSGLLRPAAQFVIYAPAHAQVESLPIAEGQHVKTGTVLLKLASPDLSSQLNGATARREHLQWQSSTSVFDSEQRAHWQVSQEALTTAEAEVSAIKADKAYYEPVAPFSGVLRDIAPDLHPGVWLSAREPLARLVSDQGQIAIAYLNEEEVNRISQGDTANFYSDGLGGPIVSLEVVNVDSDASRTISEPELTNLFGGSVVVREKNNQFYSERPVYRVTLKVISSSEELSSHAWRGNIVISGRWASPAWRYVRSAMALVRREAGF